MSASLSWRERAWISVLVCAFAMPVPAFADLNVHDHAGEQAVSVPVQIAEPFGLLTSALPDGPLQTKWRDVERHIATELAVIAQCRSDRANCSSPQAAQFLKIVDAASVQSGLARVGEINRAFNLAIRPLSDSDQYGIEDLWTSPLATLAAGAGDCEDYAIAKLVALREAGVSSEDLRIVILREIYSGEDHAVAAARVDGRWRMLDNRYFVMFADSDVTTFRPIFAIDAEGAKRFEQPSVLVATAGGTPATSSNAAHDHPDAGLSTAAIVTAPADIGDARQTQAM